MAGTLTLGGLASGLLSGEKVIGPLTMQGAATIGAVLDVALASGDTTVAVPSGASAYALVMPSSNASTLHLRTNLNASDAGLPVGPTGYLAAPLAAGTSALIVNSPSAGTVIEITFI